ncbi:hypothetical protein BSKO_00264 [Bryopsis sp. KO-2023]|nr:hypothetical protein BSKO_00264 [Bryopsis sp. KO-2023]
MAPPPTVNYSVFVGDLEQSVDENLLFEVFSKVGQVGSVRVCRDAVGRQSRGHAYVNFVPIPGTDPASKAVEELSYTKLKNKAIRVMLTKTDKSSLKNGVGNVYIKGLPLEVDSRTLHDTFEVFGKISSAKVVCDRSGVSLGYGYVQYEQAACASKAVERAHGMLLSGSKLVVVHHVRKDVRPTRHLSYTNIYVKNLPRTVDTVDALWKFFDEFGEITCVWLPEGEGSKKGYGFVNFKEPRSAARAIESMNGRIIDGVVMFVAKAQKKMDRQRMLRERFENIQSDMQQKIHGKNLYVKNIEPSIDDESFKAMFAHFGEITSSKIMKDLTGVSRGFGFVCFRTLEEASRALMEMNGRLMGSRQLYVAIAQPKAQRRAQLIREHQMLFTQGAGMSSITPENSDGKGQIPSMSSGSGALPVYPMPAHFMTNPHMMANPMMNPAINPAAHMNGMPGTPPAGFPSQNGFGPVPIPGNQNVVQGFRNRNNHGHGGRGGRQSGGRYQGRGGRSNYGGRGRSSNRAIPGAACHQPSAPRMYPAPQFFPGHMTVAESLAAVPLDQRKIMLGEKLYALIRMHNIDRAAKITGMLLELEQEDVVALLENPAMLKERVDDALKVLDQVTHGGN